MRAPLLLVCSHIFAVGADMLLAGGCICVTVAAHVLAVASVTGSESSDSSGAGAAVASGVAGLLTSLVLTLVVQRVESTAVRLAHATYGPTAHGSVPTPAAAVSYSWWAVATLPLLASWISLPVWHAVRGSAEGSIDTAAAVATALLCGAGVFAGLVSHGA